MRNRRLQTTIRYRKELVRADVNSGHQTIHAASCPAEALSQGDNDRYAEMDKYACAANSKRLRAAFRNPCGFCVKVCPVGNDRKLFRSESPAKYFDAGMSSNPHESERPGWRHIRRYDGYRLREDSKSDFSE
jgi:epoxyqueuosine reductase